MSFLPSAEMIDAVAEWEARQAADRVRRALLPSLRERFGLTNSQAVEVIRAAHRHEKGGVYVEAS